jgi:hypothetical protein
MLYLLSYKYRTVRAKSATRLFLSDRATRCKVIALAQSNWCTTGESNPSKKFTIKGYTTLRSTMNVAHKLSSGTSISLIQPHKWLITPFALSSHHRLRKSNPCLRFCTDIISNLDQSVLRHDSLLSY